MGIEGAPERNNLNRSNNKLKQMVMLVCLALSNLFGCNNVDINQQPKFDRENRSMTYSMRFEGRKRSHITYYITVKEIEDENGATKYQCTIKNSNDLFDKEVGDTIVGTLSEISPYVEKEISAGIDEVTSTKKTNYDLNKVAHEKIYGNSKEYSLKLTDRKE